MANFFDSSPALTELHVHEQLGRLRRRDVQLLQQSDPDRLHSLRELTRSD